MTVEGQPDSVSFPVQEPFQEHMEACAQEGASCPSVDGQTLRYTPS